MSKNNRYRKEQLIVIVSLILVAAALLFGTINSPTGLFGADVVDESAVDDAPVSPEIAPTPEIVPIMEPPADAPVDLPSMSKPVVESPTEIPTTEPSTSGEKAGETEEPGFIPTGGFGASGFSIAVAPSISSVVLNATSRRNTTLDNLTAILSGVSDADGDVVWNITDWRRANNTGGFASIAVLNMPFDFNVSSSVPNASPDYTTFRNNGTLGGGDEAPLWNRSGRVGGAFQFDGSDDFIQINDTPSLNPNVQNLTISAWIYPSGSLGRIVCKDDGGANRDYCLSFGDAGGPKARFFATMVAGTPTVDSTLDLPLNAWSHVVATYDGATVRLYINGTDDTVSDIASTFVESTVPLRIGRSVEGFTFPGLIDEVYIFNRTLSGAQVRELFNAGMNNRHPMTIHANETQTGEVWQVCATPTDNQSDGATVCSNNVTIRNTLIACQTLSTAGTYYLGTDLTTTLPSCFNISANDVTLDCDGLELIGNRTPNSHGINASSRNNATVKNCVVTNFSDGVFFTRVRNGTLFSNTFRNNSDDGVDLSNNNFTVISHNFAANNTDNNLEISGWFINISNNTLVNARGSLTSHGIQIFRGAATVPGSGPASYIIANNTFINNQNDGLNTAWLNDTTISGNTIVGSGDDALVLWNATTISVTGNNIGIGGDDGLLLDGTNYSYIAFNNISETVGQNLDIVQSHNNNFTNNTIYYGTLDLLRLRHGSSNNTFWNTTLVSNNSWYSVNNSVIDNNFTNTTFVTRNGSVKLGFFQANTTQKVNMTKLNISLNRAFMNATNLTYMNVSAIIILESISMTNPLPVVSYADDGTNVTCPADVCTERSYAGTSFTFNVSHWTSFAASETPPAPETVSPSGTFVINATNQTRFGFINGTFYATQFNVTYPIINFTGGNASGNFTSQIIDVGHAVTWKNISWKTSPIGELPNFRNQSVQDAQEHFLNMSDLLLLMHFNNDSAFGENGDYVYDFSGRGNNGDKTALTPELSFTPNSRLGARAARFTSSEADRVSINDTTSLGMKDRMTMSIWIYPTGFIDFERIWVKPHTSNDPPYVIWGFDLDNTPGDRKVDFTVSTGGGSGTSVVSLTRTPANVWTHIAGTYNGSDMVLYVNGQREANKSKTGNIDTNSQPVDFAYNRVFTSQHFQGYLDEAALWNRTLTDAEILKLYERGIHTINLTGVRSCDDAACSGEAITDFNTTVSPQSLSVADNRYFQYQMRFATENSTYSPELYNVTVGTEEPTVTNTSSLNLTKSDNVDPVYAGGQLNYTIIINNTGTDTAYNVTLTDAYPTNVTFVVARPVPLGPSNETFLIGNLTSGQVYMVNITVTVNASVFNATLLNNTANISWTNTTGIFNTLNTSITTTALGDIEADTCRTLSNSTTYRMSRNLTIYGNFSTCFNITADNMVINCNGFRLSGNRSEGQHGMNASALVNVTIRNCFITNFSDGIVFSRLKNATIFNNTAFNNSDDGFDIRSTNYTVFSHNNASRNFDTNILFAAGWYNNITNNSADNARGDIYSNGITITVNSKENLLINNTVFSNQNTGILVTQSDNNSVINNTVFANGEDGITLNLSLTNLVRGNLVRNNSDDGIVVDTTNFSVIDLNNASRNGDNNIILFQSNNNNITNNTAALANGPGFSNGIAISNASNNNSIINNTAIDNSDDGIQLIRSNSSTVAFNVVIGNGDDGIDVSNDTGHNISFNYIQGNFLGIALTPGFNVSIENNTIVNNTNDGIFAARHSQNNTIRRNLILNHTASGGNGINFYSNNSEQYNNVIEHNIIQRTGQNGIQVLNLSRVLFITNNSISETGLSSPSSAAIMLLSNIEASIANNTITNAHNNGIIVGVSSNITVEGNVITNSTVDLIRLNLTNNSIVRGNVFATLGNADLNSLTTVNTTLVDTIANNYSFVSSGLAFLDTREGQVFFVNRSVTVNGTNFSADVNITLNRIRMNASRTNRLNQSANLTLFGLTFATPRLAVDYGDVNTNVTCPADVCTQGAYSGGTLQFNVSHWTTFGAEETPIEAPAAPNLSSDSNGTGEWRMWGRYNNHTLWDGTTYPTIAGLNRSTYTTGNDVVSMPAVVNGFVYIGSNDNQTYQLNATNISHRIANFTARNRFGYASPVIVDGFAYIGSYDNQVYQLNATNISNKIANFTTGGFIDAPGVVANGFVYIGSGDFSFYQLNATNISNKIANFTTGGGIDSGPAIANGYVYIGSEDFQLYQLNATNISNKIANFTAGSFVYPSPAVSNGFVYTGSWDNSTYQLNATNISNKIANFTTGNHVVSSPAVANGFVYIGSYDNQVYQLNATNISNKIANFTTGGDVISSPAIANGFVYVGSNDFSIYQLNATNISNKIANFTTGAEILSSPAVANGYVYIGSDDNIIYQLNATNISMGASATVVEATTINASLMSAQALNFSALPNGNFNSSNIYEINYLLLNLSINASAGVSSWYLNFTADGLNGCALGNVQNNICYHFDNSSSQWIQYINGTNTSTFDSRKFADDDGILAVGTSSATNLNLSLRIGEHYTPNVFKHYNASYNFSNFTWQESVSQRIHRSNLIKIHLAEANNSIVMDADHYRFDITINVSALNPQSPLAIFICNSTYVSGDPHSSDYCQLVGTRTAEQVRQETHFRQAFTSTLISALGDIRYAVLHSNAASSTRYYYMKTYQAMASGHSTHWDYSTNMGTSWANLGDGYETDAMLHWFYDGVDPTTFKYSLWVNDTTGASTVYTNNVTWNITATHNWHPIAYLEDPVENATLSLPTTINFTLLDPNTDRLNGTLTVWSGSALVSTLITGLNQTNASTNWSGTSPGNYNLTLSVCELGTAELYCANETHEVTITDPSIISACGAVTQTARLNQSLNSSGNCLSIIASNVRVDCNGHNITWDGDGAAINATHQTNVTVQNCLILDNTTLKTNTTGINFTNVTVGLIRNNTIITNDSSGAVGIAITGLNASTGSLSSGILIDNNTINATGSGATHTGIRLIAPAGGGGNNTDINITNNVIRTGGTTTGSGITFTNSKQTRIENNTIIIGGTTPVIGLSGILSASTVSRNNIHVLSATTSASVTGISVSDNEGQINITRNNITMTGGTASTDIGVLHAAKTQLNISFNYFNLSSATATMRGLSISAGPAAHSSFGNNYTKGPVASGSVAAIVLSSTATLTSTNDVISTEIQYLSQTTPANTTFQNLTLEARFGKITFTPQALINGTFATTIAQQNITPNTAFFNSSSVTALNVSSVIVLNNVTFTNPEILVKNADTDNTGCSADICSLISYTGNIFTFNVSHWTNYTLRETPSPGHCMYINATTILSASQDCIVMNVSNIKLDCNGNTIFWDGNGTAVSAAHKTNLTVQNCFILDNSSLHGNGSQSNTVGINFTNVTVGLVRNNTILTNDTSGGIGVAITSVTNGLSSGILIDNNTINASGSAGGHYGIRLTGVTGSGNNTDINITNNVLRLGGTTSQTGVGVGSTLHLRIANNIIRIMATQVPLGITSLLGFTTVSANDLYITSNSGPASGIIVNAQNGNVNITRNNVTVYSPTPSATVFGISCCGTNASDVNLSFNSINFSGSPSAGGSSAGIIFASGVYATSYGNNITTPNVSTDNYAFRFSVGVFTNITSTNDFVLSDMQLLTQAGSNNTFQNLTVENQHGRITFLPNVSVTGSAAFGIGVFNITPNLTTIDTATYPTWNVSSIISLNNLALTRAQAVINTTDTAGFVMCSPETCTNLSYAGGVFRFNVSHWTQYAAQEFINVSNLTISKSDSSDPINITTQLNYTITVTSTGTGMAYNITVNDTYPPEVTFSSASPTPDAGTNGTFTIGNLSVGAVYAINISVITLNASENITINNTANVTFYNDTGGRLSYADIESTLVSNLSVAATPSPSPSPGGSSGGGGGGSCVDKCTPGESICTTGGRAVCAKIGVCADYVTTPCASGESCEKGACKPCKTEWLCDEWSECEDGIRSRACYDFSDCGTEKDMPSTSETCAPKKAVIELPAQILAFTTLMLRPTLTNPWYLGAIAFIALSMLLALVIERQLRKRFLRTYWVYATETFILLGASLLFLLPQGEPTTAFVLEMLTLAFAFGFTALFLKESVRIGRIATVARFQAVPRPTEPSQFGKSLIGGFNKIIRIRSTQTHEEVKNAEIKLNEINLTLKALRKELRKR